MKIPGADLKETPFAAVRFIFVNVTPELAAQWLHHNRKNRRIKERQLNGYVLDMKNGAWLTTHEGIAFDESGNLTDGQHRLQAIVRAKRPMLMVVSTGWPVVQGTKKTMDAVNMAANRTLGDQLHLQHGLDPRKANQVVRICNSMAAASADLRRVQKSTTDTVLGVFALYEKEISWAIENPIKQHGIGNASVMSCLAFCRALWPKESADAMQRLATGADLAAGNPLLPLRNWLMSARDAAEDVTRQTVFHHLYEFKRQRTVPQICLNSDKAYRLVMELSKVRTEKICAIYGHPLPSFMAGEKVKIPPAAGPFSAQAIEIGLSLQGAFSSTDLAARTEANVGLWLTVWLKNEWIKSAGARQYLRTEKFGKS